MFCKKSVLRNFATFSGKDLSQCLLFNKVASLRPATLLKKRLWDRCLPMNFANFLRTLFNVDPRFQTFSCQREKYFDNFILVVSKQNRLQSKIKGMSQAKPVTYLLYVQTY